MVWQIILRTSVRSAAVTIFFLFCASLAALSVQMTSTLFIGSARIEVVTDRGSVPLPVEDALGWVKSAADSVRIYYGRFPISPLHIYITSFRGGGIHNGMAFAAGDGGRITIRVGSQTSAAEFASDWTLTHEMLHLAFPSVEDKHHWIEEGIATYVEPIARIRAGHLAREKMWSDLMRDMPQGLPQRGDRGLDQTHTWGRTYWGGAIFCLMADVDIRRQTNNAKGLEHALRAILDAGGDIRHDWDLFEAFRVGDRATGTTVLENLYEKMRDKPVDVDLDALWADLGVKLDGPKVRFDEGARLASIRRAITGDPASATDNLSYERSTTILAGRTAGRPRSLR